MIPVLEARHIVRDYHVRTGAFSPTRIIHAVKDANLKVEKGKTLAIVGESGSGKSTLARILTLIDPATSGELLIEGDPVNIARNGVSKDMRRKVQMVFQNPYGSLNPRQKIGDVLGEPLAINTNLSAADRDARAHQMLAKVGLGPEHFNRYPHMFSGGQRQRIAIARALATNPSILILDEATSALDYESERVIQENMRQIVKGRTVIIIAHRLAAVRPCHRIVGMVDGRIAEVGTRRELLARPNGVYARLWALQTELAAAE